MTTINMKKSLALGSVYRHDEVKRPFLVVTLLRP
jgi:hypothetical protein